MWLSDVPLKLEARRRRATYDLVAIREWLAWWSEQGAFVTVERSGPMPAVTRGGRHLGGSLANYARGLAEGWAWMLEGLGVPYRQVAPQEWQTELLRGIAGADTKTRALAATQRRWPRLDLRRTERSRGPDPGRVDALLIAEFGRRGR